VQAAHGDAGLTVVLDLTAPDDVELPAGLLLEVHRTTSGNGQTLAILAHDGGLPGLAALRSAAGVSVHESLGDCLTDLTRTRPPDEPLRLTLPARVGTIAPVRTFLAETVRRRHGDADAFPVEILVDELFLNAIENSPSDRSSFDVAFCCDGGLLVMEVVNVFDDTIDSERIMHRRLRSFDDSGDYLGERGRGLFLVARLADGLEIRSEPPDRMRVVVTRRLGRADGSGASPRPEGEAGAAGAGQGGAARGGGAA
jgi:anti-sigma regulatory factor (Ser/Thr protein kinase)